MSAVKNWNDWRPSSDVPWNSDYLDLTTEPVVHEFGEFGDVSEEVLLSPVAVTEPFAILTDEGAAIARVIADELEAIACADERSKRLRGCGDYSEFFAGMYGDTRLIEFLSDLARADLRPHPMWKHRVQLNFPPDELSRAIDPWHYDVVAFDFVMLLTDPTRMTGGNTEYFRGPVSEGQRLLKQAGTLPKERIVPVKYPAAGWGFLQQGHQVLHRVAPLEGSCRRISMVASYYCADPVFREPTSLTVVRKIDGVDTALRQWASYAAYRTIAKLDHFLAQRPWPGRTVSEVRAGLSDAIAEAQAALQELDSSHEGEFLSTLG